MSQLESVIASSGESPLIDSLDFSLPPASISIIDRRQHVRAYPTSASSLSVNGTRTVRIRLGGDEFVDPQSIRLQFTILNGDATRRLVCTGGPWCFWGQVYLRSGCCQLDDIPQYGRFQQQYGWNHLSMLEQFGEAGISGFGGSWSTGNVQTNRPDIGGINANQAYTVLHKMHLSMFSSGKLLPTRYMPLELECTLNTVVGD